MCGLSSSTIQTPPARAIALYGQMSAGVLPTGTEKEGSSMHVDSEYIIGLSPHHDASN